ncbi:MAG: hypothetical protein IPJ40_03125 [Saprospirales bacterium]|nr:hypothetical protein [Saprospirales bacterium]
MKTLVFLILLFLLLTPPLPAPGAAMVQTHQEAVSIKNPSKKPAPWFGSSLR